jgi:hypothetical protein
VTHSTATSTRVQPKFKMRPCSCGLFLKDILRQAPKIGIPVAAAWAAREHFRRRHPTEFHPSHLSHSRPASRAKHVYQKTQEWIGWWRKLEQIRTLGAVYAGECGLEFNQRKSKVAHWELSGRGHRGTFPNPPGYKAERVWRWLEMARSAGPG